MILFAADNHYGAFPGRRIHEQIHNDFDIRFFEDDWSCFTPALLDACGLLVLNLIGDTCNVPHPDANAEAAMRNYVGQGRPILLLHGGSAAFSQWAWWRTLVGLRWVRKNDPDGVAPSWHPTRPYKVSVSKTRHPLAPKLREMELPADEIYLALEQVGPIMTLMETRTDEGTFPQCVETTTPFGGKIVSFIPGHAESVSTHADTIANIKTLIDYLAPEERRK